MATRTERAPHLINRSPKALVVWLGALLCASCSSDGIGTLYADAYSAGDATIVRVRQIGGQIRVRPDDAGVTFGVSERIYVFRTAGTDGLPSPGRSYFYVPLPVSDSIALATFTVGAEVNAGSSGIGLLLGIAQRALLARASSTESVAISVALDVSSPERAIVRVFCGFDKPC
ncbi:MAG: hypothetical protein J0H14_05085 [Alphaproteobacteria bacterium]|nr:hypothetical protein [Alphaproteobacteria bacterium]